MKQRMLRSRSGFTLVELLVVIAIIGVLAGLLLPAIQNAREAARRADCSSKIRNLALAAQQFEGAQRRYPVSIRPATSANAKPRLAALTLILPGLEQTNLYNLYQLDKDWNSDRDSNDAQRSGALNQDFPTNRAIAEQKIPIFLCPSSTNPDRRDGDPEVKTYSSSNRNSYDNPAWSETVAVTDYSPVLGATPRLINSLLTQTPAPTGIRPGQGILSSQRPGRAADVKDGLTNTIMFAESAGRPNVYRTGRQVGDVSTNRVNGGGWARPGSDFYIDGSKITNPMTRAASFPGTPSGLSGVNITNGEDIQGVAFTAATGFDKANGSSINTIMANPGSTAWYDAVTTTTPAQTGFYGTGEIYSFHPGGANVAFGDAATRFINSQINIEDLARLATREGAEIIGPNAFE